MSIAELNAEIEKGSIIREDGTIEAFVPVDTTPEETQAPTENETTPAASEPTTTDATIDNSDEADPIVTPSTDGDAENPGLGTTPFVIGAIAIVVVASVMVSTKRRKARASRLEETAAVDEEEVNV